ncbi:MAG TPA: hypothetical protein VLT86_17360 [Vicinamibacterales bacterium]|nr:hypothetical protein [Vicinamibacterales bacterium]
MAFTPRAVRGPSVSATDAVRRFSALIDRVRETRTGWVIEAHGEAVAEIVPAARRVTLGDFRAFLRDGPRAPESVLDAVAAESRTARAEREPAPPRLSGRGGRKRHRE